MPRKQKKKKAIQKKPVKLTNPSNPSLKKANYGLSEALSIEERSYKSDFEDYEHDDFEVFSDEEETKVGRFHEKEYECLIHGFERSILDKSRQLRELRSSVMCSEFSICFEQIAFSPRDFFAIKILSGVNVNKRLNISYSGRGSVNASTAQETTLLRNVLLTTNQAIEAEESTYFKEELTYYRNPKRVYLKHCKDQFTNMAPSMPFATLRLLHRTLKFENQSESHCKLPKDMFKSDEVSIYNARIDGHQHLVLIHRSSTQLMNGVQLLVLNKLTNSVLNHLYLDDMIAKLRTIELNSVWYVAFLLTTGIIVFCDWKTLSTESSSLRLKTNGYLEDKCFFTDFYLTGDSTPAVVVYTRKQKIIIFKICQHDCFEQNLKFLLLFSYNVIDFLHLPLLKEEISPYTLLRKRNCLGNSFTLCGRRVVLSMNLFSDSLRSQTEIFLWEDERDFSFLNLAAVTTQTHWPKTTNMALLKDLDGDRFKLYVISFSLSCVLDEFEFSSSRNHHLCSEENHIFLLLDNRFYHWQIIGDRIKGDDVLLVQIGREDIAHTLVVSCKRVFLLLISKERIMKKVILKY